MFARSRINEIGQNVFGVNTGLAVGSSNPTEAFSKTSWGMFVLIISKIPLIFWSFIPSFILILKIRQNLLKLTIRHLQIARNLWEKLFDVLTINFVENGNVVPYGVACLTFKVFSSSEVRISPGQLLLRWKNCPARPSASASSFKSSIPSSSLFYARQSPVNQY